MKKTLLKLALVSGLFVMTDAFPAKVAADHVGACCADCGGYVLCCNGPDCSAEDGVGCRSRYGAGFCL